MKRKAISLLETDFPKRYSDYLSLDAIAIAYFEKALSEFLVPTDSVQQFLDGDHSILLEPSASRLYALMM